MVASTHWLASAAGMACSSRAATRSTRRSRPGFDAAGRRAAPQRPRRRRAGPPVRRRARRAARRLRAGPGARRRATIARSASSGSSWCRAPACSPPCVPGAFDALDAAAARPRDAAARATSSSSPIHYAEHGFPLLPRIAVAIADSRRAVPRGVADLGRALARPAAARPRRAAVAQPDARRDLPPARRGGRGGRAGRETQIQAARDAFLRGFVAEAIADFVAPRRGHGQLAAGATAALLTGDDLAAFAATFEPPVTLDYRGLHGLQGRRRGARARCCCSSCAARGLRPRRDGPPSADYVHTVLECAKLAFADREAWYGDPASPTCRSTTLLSRALRRRAPRAGRRGGVVRPAPGRAGRPRAAAGARARRRGASAAGFGVRRADRRRGDGPTRGDTCHVDVVDRHGNMVSATPSGGWLHASPAIPGLGLLPRHAGADVLARGGPAELARAGQAAPDDA